jgi:hypothetical protein
MVKKARSQRSNPASSEEVVHTAARHASARAARKAAVVLEDSATVPSRKSTRKGKNRGRPSERIERREQNRLRSPETRARTAMAKKARVRGRP